MAQDMVTVLMGAVLLLFVLEASYGVSTESVVSGFANALNPFNVLDAAFESAGNGLWGALAAVAMVALLAYGAGFAASSLGFENLLMAGAFLVFLLLVV